MFRRRDAHDKSVCKHPRPQAYCLQHKEYAAGDEQRADKHAQGYFLVEEDKRQKDGDDDAEFVDGRNTRHIA